MVNIKELINLEGNEEKPRGYNSEGDLSPIFRPVREIEYKGKSVVFSQAKGDTPYVIVPGFRTSDNYRTETGSSAVKVETVDDKKTRKEIEKLLQGITEGPISFW